MSEHENKSILDKIKKLIDKAKSTDSIEESETFMMKAQSMLQEYNISVEQIESHSVVSEKTAIEEKFIPYGENFELKLAQFICNNNFCNLINHPQESRFSIIGKTCNAEVVVYLYTFFRRTLMSLSIPAYNVFLGEKKKEVEAMGIPFDKLSGKSAMQNKFMQDFLMGGVYGVNQKMKEQKQKAIEASPKLTDIVIANDMAVSKYIEQKYKNLHYGRAKKMNFSTDGFKRGQAAGYGIDARSGITERGTSFVQKRLG